MSTTAEKVRSYKGPVIFSFGFRPFFLAGALWAAVAVALWLPMLSGHIALPTAFSPLQWHAHELIYGYVPAIAAGFLLTAVPNWTGRLPVTGMPLFILFAIWFAGRFAIMLSGMIGGATAAIADLLFLAALGGIIGREIIAGSNARNFKILAVVALLFAGNAAFHLEALYAIGSGHGLRIGVASSVLLIMLIGGRIIPSFTRNWLAKQPPGRLPGPFDRIDAGIIAAGGLALASWVFVPDHAVTAALGVVAGLANIGRLSRWAGERTAREPLVAILHIAYVFIPAGFLLTALGIWRPDVVLPSGALHAWTAGAIGLMTLAVMTRASLGHTGKALSATRPVVFIYLSAGVAALTRIIAAFDLMRAPLLHVSAAAWVLAFAGFVVVYAPLLMRARR